MYAMPKSRLISFNYMQTFTITPGTVKLVNAHPFDPRNPNKPDTINALGTIPGAHQPYGWDQWAAFYERYTVESCTCTVNTFDVSFVDSIPMVWDLLLVNNHKKDEISGAEYHKLLERRLIPAGMMTNSSQGDGRKTFLRQYKSKSWNFKKWYGRHFPIRNHSSAYTAAPADVENNAEKEPLFLILCTEPELASGGTVTFQLRMTYVVRLRDLKPVTHS